MAYKKSFFETHFEKLFAILVILIVVFGIVKCTDDVIISQNNYVECYGKNDTSLKYNQYEIVGDRMKTIDKHTNNVVFYPLYSCVEVLVN